MSREKQPILHNYRGENFYDGTALWINEKAMAKITDNTLCRCAQM